MLMGILCRFCRCFAGRSPCRALLPVASMTPRCNLAARHRHAQNLWKYYRNTLGSFYNITSLFQEYVFLRTHLCLDYFGELFTITQFFPPMMSSYPLDTKPLFHSGVAPLRRRGFPFF